MPALREFAVAVRCVACFLFEDCREIFGVVESCDKCDLFDLQAGVGQHFHTFADLDFLDVIDGGKSRVLFENAPEPGIAHADLRGDTFGGDAFVVVFGDEDLGFVNFVDHLHVVESQLFIIGIGDTQEVVYDAAEHLLVAGVLLVGDLYGLLVKGYDFALQADVEYGLAVLEKPVVDVFVHVDACEPDPVLFPACGRMGVVVVPLPGKSRNMEPVPSSLGA